MTDFIPATPYSGCYTAQNKREQVAYRFCTASQRVLNTRANHMNQINADQPILALSHITKRFGGNIAVNDVSLQVMPGEVLALLGENGAGKSTLIKVLAGVYPRDGGDMQFRGTSIASAAAIKVMASSLLRLFIRIWG